MILSIIIPVYNAEKYISRCLKSVFKAVALSKVETEVILVDNYSTDNSLARIFEFLKEAPAMNVKVKRCHAKGAAAVRNFGANEASGKYVWFVDTDDEVFQDSVRLLTDEAKKTGADMVMMGAKRIYPDKHQDYLSAVDPSSSDYKSRFIRYGMGPWQILIRREWWNKNKFSFREGIIHEDMEMISSLILYTDKFAAVDKPLYTYYQNNDSVLHKSSWDPHYLDIFPALSGLYARFEKAGAAEKYRDELEWFFIWNLLIDSAKDFSKFKEGRGGFKETRGMLKEYFPNWRKNRFLKQKPLKLRIKVRLNYYKK